MTITVNNISIYYEKAGTGQQIILAHGNGENHEIFDKIIEPLSQKYCVYAVDTRGHGKSDKVPEFNYNDIADDFVEFIKKLGLQKPMFYGFSDGGIVGLIIASQYPDLLDKLIVSGVNVNPKGLKSRWLLLYNVIYFFTRSKKVKLMLQQPNISDEKLKKITTSTLLLVAENDVVKSEHTQHIANQIPVCNLKIIERENHSSYVIHNDKLLEYIEL
jgi:pimeloyl-ACP methyl ester carboxylesterase